MNNFELLAKSEPPISLKQHIEDCLQVETQLIECFPNLPVKASSLWELLRKAICFHDIGKCHKEFQKVLYKKKNIWSNRRHELFSIPFVLNSNIPEKEQKIVLLAIIGHHKDIEEVNNLVIRDYYGFDAAEKSHSTRFDSDCSLLFCNKAWKILAQYNFDREDNGSVNIITVIRETKKLIAYFDNQDFLLQLLLVGYLKHCDHLASAGIKHLKKLTADKFTFLHTFSPYLHQKKASQTTKNVFLTAPTGSGKTETSLLWLENQIEKVGQGRTFYILPYIASINAMYERLASNIGNDYIGMLHSKLAQYIDSKFDEYNDGRELTTIKEHYKTLVMPLKIVTPFQLLKNLFGLKHFEKGMAEWVGGYFIFDEIHAYDGRTFAQIVLLIEMCIRWFKGKVFIMTATMPTHMFKILKKIVKDSIKIEAENALYHTFNRHKIYMKDGVLFDSTNEIQNEIDSGKKVLVVCNTIEEAQKIYCNLECESKILLHSSFNSIDRSIKEQRLNNNEIQLLVGTQAVEVSLDIDYDTIYTEPAPIDALIQRFGRVNRKCSKGICPCHIFRKWNRNDEFIYDKSIVEDTLKILERIDGQILYEKDIQNMIDQVYPCFTEAQQKEYDITYQALTIGIKERLRPLLYDKKSEEDFYEQFDGIKVLPVSLCGEYKYYLENKQFVKAEGLMVSIRESRFSFMFKNKDIYRQRICYSMSDDNITEKCIMVINRKYDAEIGLQMKVEDTNTYNNEL